MGDKSLDYYIDRFDNNKLSNELDLLFNDDENELLQNIFTTLKRTRRIKSQYVLVTRPCGCRIKVYHYYINGNNFNNARIKLCKKCEGNNVNPKEIIYKIFTSDNPKSEFNAKTFTHEILYIAKSKMQ